MCFIGVTEKQKRIVAAQNLGLNRHGKILNGWVPKESNLSRSQMNATPKPLEKKNNQTIPTFRFAMVSIYRGGYRLFRATVPRTLKAQRKP
jgi:hypothetical protein